MKYFPFYILVVSIFLALVGYELWSDGMFMDGLLYADIALNLAEGKGTFWNLHLTNTLLFNFHEHPPLAMGFLSLFYKFFGTSILVERFYSLLAILLSGLILIAIWRQIADKKYKDYGFIALFFLFIIPVVSWAAKNNMLENTMMIFTSLAFLFLIYSTKLKNRILWIYLASLSILFAFLSKGLTSFYIFSFYFWILIFIKEYRLKSFFVDTLLIVAFFGLNVIFLFAFFPNSIDSLQLYFNQQVINSLEHVVTVESRTFILIRFLSELIPVLSIVLILFIFFRKKLDFSNIWILPLFGIALSGVLPIIISLKQSGFYILTVYPFVSLSLALVITPVIHEYLPSFYFRFKRLFIVSVAVLLFSIIGFSVYCTKKVSRDVEMLHDIYLISSIVERDQTISISHNISDNWAAHGYFYRHKRISLDHKKLHEYYLVFQQDSLSDDTYTKVDLDLKYFQLYKKLNLSD